jgi:hypothetical protein
MLALTERSTNQSCDKFYVDFTTPWACANDAQPPVTQSWPRRFPIKARPSTSPGRALGGFPTTGARSRAPTSHASLCHRLDQLGQRKQRGDHGQFPLAPRASCTAGRPIAETCSCVPAFAAEQPGRRTASRSQGLPCVRQPELPPRLAQALRIGSKTQTAPSVACSQGPPAAISQRPRRKVPVVFESVDWQGMDEPVL